MLHRLLSTHCRAFQRSLRHVPPLDAFHVVSTTDPLADSDEEYDDHVRYDYGMFIIALDVPYLIVLNTLICGLRLLRVE